MFIFSKIILNNIQFVIYQTYKYYFTNYNTYDIFTNIFKQKLKRQVFKYKQKSEVILYLNYIWNWNRLILIFKIVKNNLTLANIP